MVALQSFSLIYEYFKSYKLVAKNSFIVRIQNKLKISLPIPTSHPTYQDKPLVSSEF